MWGRVLTSQTALPVPEQGLQLTLLPGSLAWASEGVFRHPPAEKSKGDFDAPWINICTTLGIRIQAMWGELDEKRNN